MSSEMNFQSISDLPVIEGIADGDYIVTVSGGKGKLLPAGNFTGGSKLTIFEFAQVAAASAASEDGIDAQVAVATENALLDADGNRVTDPAVFREAMLAGPLLFKYVMEGATAYGTEFIVVDDGSVITVMLAKLGTYGNIDITIGVAER